MSSFESFHFDKEQDFHMSSEYYKTIVHAHEMVFCILGVLGADSRAKSVHSRPAGLIHIIGAL